MKRYITVRCILLCMIVVVLSGLASTLLLSYTREQATVRNMRDLLTVISMREELKAPANRDYDALTKEYNRLAFDYRLTLLDTQGNVLGDSGADGEAMENHAQRPEIRQAMAAGTGYARRDSATLGQAMIYVSLREGDLVYRLAAPVDSVRASLWELAPVLVVGLLLALFISPVLARRTAESITAPLVSAVDSLKTLTAGSYEVKLMPSEFDELAPIASTVNTLTRQISDTISELTRQKEKTEYLLDNMMDGLVLVDHDLRILQSNAAARRFLGASKAEEGHNLLLLTRRPKLLAAAESAAATGESALFDLDCTESLGLILSVHVTAIRSDWISRGEENGVVILLSDVTQDRRASELRSEFVANASHELKTPITSIGGFAELLTAGVVTDETQRRDYLERICGETRRMSALIDDILRLSSLESGENSELAPEELPLRQVVEEAIANLQPQLEQRRVTATVEADDTVLSMTRADGETLLTNLLENAVKYNVEGGTLNVRVRRVGQRVRLTVTDTGIGIPREAQPRIFERFYRVDQGRSRRVGGTGLGLSIVKHIAAKYGGDINLTSEEGKGTRITVSFPCGKAKAI